MIGESLERVGSIAEGTVDEGGHSPLERAAYHEAGHAVVAYVLERAFTGMPIVAEPAAPERCRYADLRNFDPDLPQAYNGPRIRTVIERQIVGYLAGPVAEGALTGEKDWRKAGGRGDVPRAVDLAMYVTGDIKKAEAYLRLLWAQTEAIVRREENWAAIEALAAYLVEHREIDAEQAWRMTAEKRGAPVTADVPVEKQEHAYVEKAERSGEAGAA